MARNDAIRRMWHVIALLRSCGGVTLAKLASETGVTVRTIRRDLELLEAAGVPIVTDVESGGDSRGLWSMVRGAPCPTCGRLAARSAELRRELVAVRQEDARP